MGKLTISMAIFHGYVTNYQRVMKYVCLQIHRNDRTVELKPIIKWLASGNQIWQWENPPNYMQLWPFISYKWL